MALFIRRSLQVAFDLVVLSTAFWLAFLFRFEFSIPKSWLTAALVGWPYVVLIGYGMLSAFGVPRASWRYISIRETARIGVALASSTAILCVLRIVLPRLFGDAALIPYGVLCMNFFLGFFGLVGARATRRILGET